MCTAATYQSAGFYFGRTLDYEVSYGNQIVITPRNYALRFRHTEDQPHHYAIIGMGLVAEDYPLYYDAMNEKGLCMAGLNFVGNAVYSAPSHDKENVAQFEFIPWLLGQCANLAEAKEKLQNLQLTDTLFNTAMPRAQLHWIIADRTGAVVVESMADGLHLYDNPVGVLTNNPPFPEQMRHLSLYQGLSPCQPENNVVPGAELPLFSRGMGAYGLPGDLSSPSRFVKAAFTRANAKSARSETDAVSQLLHILGSVEQQRGCCQVAEDKYEITLYTSCCSADTGTYYYTTYDNHRICAVRLSGAEADSASLQTYPLQQEQDILYQN